jgi:hypothetical protein
MSGTVPAKGFCAEFVEASGMGSSGEICGKIKSGAVVDSTTISSEVSNEIFGRVELSTTELSLLEQAAVDKSNIIKIIRIFLNQLTYEITTIGFFDESSNAKSRAISELAISMHPAVALSEPVYPQIV